MDFKIIVKKQKNQTSQTLETYGDLDINIIYNISDIRNPESIKSNYTKQFDIPATKLNNKFFEGILYNGYFPNEFNPNLKVDCQLMVDDSEIIDGYLQLVEIKKNAGVVDSYSIIIYGEISSIFSKLNDLYLRDLDFSEYNHVWNYKNITNSWDTSIKRNNVDVSFLKGRGYVYPFEYRGSSNDYLQVEDFFPATYVKEILDKAFKYSGKRYTSNFFESDFFKSLILSYNKAHIYLTEDQIALREFEAKKSTSELLTTMSPLVATTSNNFLVKFDQEVSDVNNLWQSNAYYIPKNKVNNNLGIDLNLKVIYTAAVSSSTPWVIGGPNMTATAVLKNITTGQVLKTETVEIVNPYGTILGAASSTSSVQLTYENIFELNNQYAVYINFTVPAGNASSKFINSSGQAVNGNINCYVESNSTILSTVTNAYLYEGDTIDMTQTLPDKVKISDFITSLNKLFNLYWIPDGDGNFIIEPRDDFYAKSDAKIIDWTDNIDRDNEITIIPLKELNNKKYDFYYTEDQDYYNTEYTNTEKNKYGERSIEIINDFLTETLEIVPLFSPSPITQYKDTDIACNSFVEYIDGYFETYEGNTRISIYGGLLNTSSKWRFKASENSYNVLLTKYPYAGHLNHPNTPSIDIMYGKCKHYFYNWINLTTNNLYNKYWKNTINDIIAIDSHLFKAKAHLRYYEILSLKLYDTIQVDEVYYKINSINFNPITEIADIELFKTTYFNSKSNSLIVKPTYSVQTNSTGVITGQVGGFGSVWKAIDSEMLVRSNLVDISNFYFHTESTELSEFGNQEQFNQIDLQNISFGSGKATKRNVNGNTYQKENFIELNGANNYVSPGTIGVKVLGDNNQISSNAKNINIVGNRNYVENGIENVTVIGNNIYVSKSNSTYIDGKILNKDGFVDEYNYINGGVNEVLNPFGSAQKPNLIRAGINAVLNIGGMSPRNLIKGGIDKS